MPLNIMDMTSEVTVYEGDLPLDQAQIDKLVKIVLKRLAEQQREVEQLREATKLRREAAPGIALKE
jgi:hypothetical protein